VCLRAPMSTILRHRGLPKALGLAAVREELRERDRPCCFIMCILSLTSETRCGGSSSLGDGSEDGGGYWEGSVTRERFKSMDAVAVLRL
jgi:hypothetical protein